MLNTEQTQEKWQVDARGRIFDTDFAEMTAWIDEGVMHRQDKVRKGNLRWIEAGKVPSLVAVFNAKESGQTLPPPVVTMTKLSPTTIPGTSSTNPPNFRPPTVTAQAPPTGAQLCSMHPDVPASFVCATCLSLFCKACPNSYGGSVKICPYCGAMCDPIAKAATADNTYRPINIAPSGGHFGFSDLIDAFAYPFRFKTSLILGAILFAVFSLGQSIVGFDGIFMLSSAIICAMLANTLTFGILANTVENMSQGKLGENFMPTFEDFSLWDDVVQPFFLMIGVYISSFGPLVLLMVIAFFMVAGTAGKNGALNGPQSDAARMIDPSLPGTPLAVEQAKKIREIAQKNDLQQRQRLAEIEGGDVQPDATRTAPEIKDPEELEFDRVNQMIRAQEKAQLESAVGKAPDTVAAERAEMLKTIVGYGAVFLLLGGLCALWGIFYYPAACAVAGYTQSFASTLNPLVGLDTIRRLGADYVKILLMCLVIGLFSGAVMGVLSVVFIAFDMPGVGNIPAKFVFSFFGFYFSVVFAVVIGSALYKAADRLELPGS